MLHVCALVSVATWGATHACNDNGLEVTMPFERQCGAGATPVLQVTRKSPVTLPFSPRLPHTVVCRLQPPMIVLVGSFLPGLCHCAQRAAAHSMASCTYTQINPQRRQTYIHTAHTKAVPCCLGPLNVGLSTTLLNLSCLTLPACSSHPAGLRTPWRLLNLIIQLLAQAGTPDFPRTDKGNRAPWHTQPCCFGGAGEAPFSGWEERKWPCTPQHGSWCCWRAWHWCCSEWQGTYT